MSESQRHMKLVKLIEDYMTTQLSIDTGHILMDIPQSQHCCKPPLIEAYRPDVIAKTDDMIVIGEAKTADWGSRHSLAQYRAYLKECQNDKRKALLLLAVPWKWERSLRSCIQYTYSEAELRGVEVIIISDLWRS